MYVPFSFDACARGTGETTREAAREVNLTFNSVVAVPNVTSAERLQLSVIDVAMVQQPALGFGPKLLASTNIALEDDFDGWIDLTPTVVISGCGPPVIQLSVRIVKFGGNEVPGVGNTQALTGIFATAPSLELLQEQPEMEPLLGAVDKVTVQRMPEASGSSGVPQQQPQQQQLQPQQQQLQRQASGRPDVQKHFFVAEEAFTCAPVTVWILKHLQDMQDGGRLYPFASAPFRDFNIFGAGWNRAAGDYGVVYKWTGHSKGGLPRMQDIDGCLKWLRQIEADDDHPQWCEGVRAIIVWLDLLKDLIRVQRKHGSFK